MGFFAEKILAFTPLPGESSSSGPGLFMFFQGEILPLKHKVEQKTGYFQELRGGYAFPAKTCGAVVNRKESLPLNHSLLTTRPGISHYFLSTQTFLLLILVSLYFACYNLQFLHAKEHEVFLPPAEPILSVNDKPVVVKDVQADRQLETPIIHIDLHTLEVYGMIAILAINFAETVFPDEKAPASSPGYKTETYPARHPVICGVPEGHVALTFDDGPSPYTQRIVDILAQHGVKATFFFIGSSAARYPDAVRYAAGNGMEVGSHSWSHGNMNLLSSTFQRDDITRTNEILSSIINRPVTVYRPPFGNFNVHLQKNLDEQGMQLILWNRDIRDWNVSGKSELLSRFYNTNPSGGIYVLHERGYTLEALPEIIAYLKQRALTFLVFQ